MAYRDLVDQLGSSTASKVLGQYRAWSAGDITVSEFRSVLVATITKANARARALASLGLSADLTTALGVPVPPTPTPTPQGETDRLGKAAKTLTGSLADAADPEGHVRRLGRAEPLTAAQRAFGEGMKRSRHVKGWVRSLEPDACQLCTWWWREGRVWPADHRMPTHQGCLCTQKPTVI